MDRPLIPPNLTLLTALGAVAIFVTPSQQAEKRQYSPPESGHRLRNYSNGDPMGKSYGETVTGTDGAVYLKIEMYRWVSDGFLGHARQWADGYILLSEEDKTWSRPVLLIVPTNPATTPGAVKPPTTDLTKTPGDPETDEPKPSWFKKNWWVIAVPLVAIIAFFVVRRMKR